MSEIVRSLLMGKIMAMDMAASPTPQRSPRGYNWLSVMELEPGMVTARPIFGNSGTQMTLHLATGSPLTASTIAQLVNKGVESVAVLQEPSPDRTSYTSSVIQYELRLHQIFGPQLSKDCRPLFDAMLADGP